MKVLITQSAESDLEEAADFYEDQQPGLGDYFMRMMVEEIDGLASSGGVHARIWGYHKLVSTRFPHLILYFVRDEVVHVRAVVDGRKHPARIRRTVTQRRKQDEAP